MRRLLCMDTKLHIMDLEYQTERLRDSKKTRLDIKRCSMLTFRRN